MFAENKLMKKILLLYLFIIYSATSFGQERINRNDIYLKDKLAYTKADNKLFTGIAESRTGKGHLTFEEEYKEGYKSKYTLYYNGSTLAAREIYYHDRSLIKQKEVKYSGDKSKTWFRHYDVNGSKVLEETYENSKLIYSCEFRDNKKHGKEFCITKKSDFTEFYENGKKVTKQ
jgi:antitoxin component YwqK of YwqJK toxin-antitoxin module